MTAPVRVATYLLELGQRRGGTGPIDLPMSRRAMADHLDLSVETLCHVLSRFAETGFIAIPNVSQVEIVDVRALEAISTA